MTKTLSILCLFAFTSLQAQPPSTDAAARFLGQASWGADSASVALLHSSKVDVNTTFANYIKDQFDTTLTPISQLTDVTVANPATMKPSFTPAQAQFFFNAVNGKDQLRQRVAFALHEQWVISGVKINQVNTFLPYYRILLADASKNFYDVMYDITLNPGMGHYLDMVNNDKVAANSSQSPNENYAREILQLFTLGTVQLDEKGEPLLDKNKNQIPMYSQDVIEGLAHVFTGWTYAPAVAGTVSKGHNPANFASPMVAVESLHDTGAKLVISRTGTYNPATGITTYQMNLPAGKTAEQDLTAALQEIFHNPNLPPFVCKQLIQHLVTSNPSPAYVQSVVNVFKDNGKGVRGDMQAVVAAILLHPEARTGDTGVAPLSSHLQEPVRYIAGLMRELGVPVALGNNLASYSSNMGQTLFFPPTVFSYFSPSYAVPGTTDLVGPEFQTYSPATAMVRCDFVNTLVYGNTFKLDLTAFETAASKDVSTLEALLNSTLLHGSMSSALKAAIETTYKAIVPTGKTAADLATAAKEQAQAALYLTAVSPEYQLQR